MRTLLVCAALAVGAGCMHPAETVHWTPLFPGEGIPAGWVVRHWSDVGKPPPTGAVWEARGGILHGSNPRGTWLVSERRYGDFAIDFEFRLGPQGNSGFGLRFPDVGDPAFDGLEIQMVDPRYYGSGGSPGPDELAGSLYKALAPSQQVFRPEDWNRYEITCRGPRVTVVLNGVTVQDVDLDRQTAQLERGVPLKDRPRGGHIGFQELSRGGGIVQIRNARIRELK